MNILELKDFHMKYERSGFEIGPNFNLKIKKGDFVGLVGESGCGKSTIGKVLIGLINDSEKENFGVGKLKGSLNYTIIDNQINYFNTSYKTLTELRKSVQMIFQNPRSALNLKMSVINTLLESARIGNPDYTKSQLLKIIYDKVIKTEFLHKKIRFEDFLNNTKMISQNGSLSGGERRRVSIAKVMCMNPDVIVADEPLASLDAAIKNNILKYFVDEWNERKNSDNPLTLILISHDIGVVSNVCNRVVVMFGDLINKRGDIVEEFNAPSTFKLDVNNNYHPFTNELVQAATYFRTDEVIVGKNTLDVDINKHKPNLGCVYGAVCLEKEKECEKDLVLKEINNEKGHYTSCIKQ